MKTLYLLLICGFVCAVLTGPASGITRTAGTNDADYITLASTTYPSAGGMVDYGSLWITGAVQVAPDWVLTNARPYDEGTMSGTSGNTKYYTVGWNGTYRANVTTAIAAYRNPTVPLVLYHLASSVPFTPAPISAGAPVVGTEVAITGGGWTGDGANGDDGGSLWNTWNDPASKFHAAQTAISSVAPTMMTTTFRTPEAGGLPLEGGPDTNWWSNKDGPGDTGSPLYVNGAVAGILNTATGPDFGQYGAIGNYVRLDTVLAWLQSPAEGVTTGVTIIPEPSTLVLLVTGLVAVFGVRRFRRK